jgi:tetratricopeptide (TPR) repeat protein
MLADALDSFAWGDVRHTLLGAAVTDAARLSRVGDDRGEQLLQQLLDDPLLSPALDDALIERLLARAEALVAADQPAAGASLAATTLGLASRFASELIPDVQLELARGALLSGAVTDAEAAARAVVGEPGKDPGAKRLVAGCDVLGRALYDQGRHAEALPVLLDGAEHAEDARQEWDLVTNAAACHLALGDPVAALELVTGRAEPLARGLGDPVCLTKSLGDLGNARLTLRQTEAARSAFAEALECAREAGAEQAQSDWLGNLGSLALLDGDVASAEALHREALEHSRRAENPRSAIVDLGHLAQACASQEKWSEALASLEEAVQVAEGLADTSEIRAARTRLRGLHAHLGHWRKAVALDLLLDQPPETLARPALRTAPPIALPVPTDPGLTEEERALVTEVEELVGRRELDRARELTESFVRADAGSFIAHFERGLVLNESGEYHASLEAYDRALALSPRWPSIHYNALNSWLAIGDLDSPLRRYERAVTDDPYDPVQRMVLGRLYGMLDRQDDAVRELREAARLDSENWVVQQVLCEGLANAAGSMLGTDWDAAWAVFQEALAEFGRLAGMDPDRRATALTIVGERSRQIALDSGFANPSLLGGLGEREARVLGHAVASFAEAMRLAPERRRPRAGFEDTVQLVAQLDDASIWTEYGVGLAEAGEPELATDALERSLAANPRNADARFQLGRLLIETAGDDSSRLERARTLIEEAAQIDPDDPRYAGASWRVAAELAAREAT